MEVSQIAIKNFHVNGNSFISAVLLFLHLILGTHFVLQPLFMIDKVRYCRLAEGQILHNSHSVCANS